MTKPDLAAPGRFKAGDTLAPGKDGIGGEIVLVRDLGPDRQQLYFRDGGGLRSYVVALEPNGARVMAPPIATRDALTLAEMILAGHPPRSPVSAQLNTLAAALLALHEDMKGSRA